MTIQESYCISNGECDKKCIECVFFNSNTFREWYKNRAE